MKKKGISAAAYKGLSNVYVIEPNTVNYNSRSLYAFKSIQQ
jgi:hypothetical protein